MHGKSQICSDGWDNCVDSTDMTRGKMIRNVCQNIAAILKCSSSDIPVFLLNHEWASGCTNDFQYQKHKVLDIMPSIKIVLNALAHAKDHPEVKLCLFYSALNERTFAVNWKIKSSIT